MVSIIGVNRGKREYMLGLHGLQTPTCFSLHRLPEAICVESQDLGRS
jgi:hypothetical protein